MAKSSDEMTKWWLLLGAALIVGVAAWSYHRPDSTAASQVVEVDKTEAKSGVLHYCVVSFELPSCLSYAAECGDQCKEMLAPPLRQRMLSEYNQYLVAQGQPPLQVR